MSPSGQEVARFVEEAIAMLTLNASSEPIAQNAEPLIVAVTQLTIPVAAVVCWVTHKT